ncbi:MAG: PucR family transcriptional regulator [Candidatus Binatia bacterium]
MQFRQRALTTVRGRAHPERRGAPLRLLDESALDRALLHTTEPPPVSIALRRLTEGLLADSEPLVSKIVAAKRALPEFREIRDESFWKQVEELTRVNVRYGYRVFLDERPPTEEEEKPNHLYTRRCVQEGVSLRSYLSGYRKERWSVWSHLVSEVMKRRPALKGELLVRMLWVLRRSEWLNTPLTEMYCAEQEGQARHRYAALRELLDEILSGGPSLAAELRARASALGIDFEATYNLVVLAVEPDKSLPATATLAALVARAAGISEEEIVAVERGRETVHFAPLRACGVAEQAFCANLAAALSARSPEWPAVAAGVSGAVQGVEEIRQGYREARRALELSASRAASVGFYPSLVLDDVLDPAGIAGRRLVRESLGALLDRGAVGRRYLDTLAAYFRAGMSVKVAAASLGIHPNSLLYRLRRIWRITGIDIGDAEQRMRVEIALRLLPRDPSFVRTHKVVSPN